MAYLAFSFELTGLPAFLLIIVLFYLFVYLPIKFLFFVFAKIKQKGDRLKRLHERTIIAEYEAPKGLTPAEIGFLYDAKLNVSEIYGTIVYLEQQGLVVLGGERETIESVEQHTPATLRPFEAYVLGYASEHARQPITMKLLDGAQGRGNLLIKRQLREAGYLLSVTEQLKRSALRLGLIGLSLIILTIALTTPSGADGILALIIFIVMAAPLYVIVSICLYFLIQKIAGEPWLLSPSIRKVWPEIEGFSQYIKLVELDNLQFESKTNRGVIKNKTLPYAIALGYNTGWRQRLK